MVKWFLGICRRPSYDIDGRHVLVEPGSAGFDNHESWGERDAGGGRSWLRWGGGSIV